MGEDPATRPDLLRATSDQLIQAIAEVDARERQKRGVPPGDAGFVDLAREVRQAAEAVLELARQEESTAEQTTSAGIAAALPPIESLPPAKELATILERWRAVEHRLDAAESGSAEASELMAEFERMRDLYAHAVKSRQERC